MPLFSVIIPTCNRAALLREALDSVFAQSFTDYEVIVVDDGSTDETTAVIASKGDRIRFFRQQNQGPGAARNFGIKNAAGKYIAFLDSDDYWLPWALEVVASCVASQASPAMVVMKLQDFSVKDELARVRHQPVRYRVSQDYIAAAQRSGYTVLTCSSVVLRTADLCQVGGFADGDFNGEDSDLWLRLGAAPGFVEVESPVGCGYRRHAGSAVGNLEKTHAGMVHIMMNEFKGVYPGGGERALERRNIITRHVRPVSLDLAKRGAHRQAIELYRRTLRWHVSSGRMKYLFGFWLILIKQIITCRQD